MEYDIYLYILMQ